MNRRRHAGEPAWVRITVLLGCVGVLSFLLVCVVRFIGPR